MSCSEMWENRNCSRVLSGVNRDNHFEEYFEQESGRRAFPFPSVCPTEAHAPVDKETVPRCSLQHCL